MFSTHHPTFTNPSTPLQPVQPNFTLTTLPGHSYGLHPQFGHSFAQPTPIPTMVPPMGLPSFSGSTATFNHPAPFLSPTHPTYPTLPSPHFTPPKFINAMLWVDTSTNPSPHILRTRYPDATNPLYTDILPTTTKDAKRTHLSDKVQWNGRLDTFHSFKKTVQAHMLRNDAGYCVHPVFMQ